MYTITPHTNDCVRDRKKGEFRDWERTVHNMEEKEIKNRGKWD